MNYCWSTSESETGGGGSETGGGRGSETSEEGSETGGEGSEVRVQGRGCHDHHDDINHTDGRATIRKRTS